jgi:lipase
MNLLRTPLQRTVKIFEKGVGTPIVFLHSGVGSSREWQGVFEAWPTGYRLIAVDAYRGGSGPGPLGRVC